MTDEQIDAAENYATNYDDDDRDCIKTDVMNAFYAGAAWQAALSAPMTTDNAKDADNYKDKYFELIMQVGNKYPNETRHETALRYLREREARVSDGIAYTTEQSKEPQ